MLKRLKFLGKDKINDEEMEQEEINELLHNDQVTNKSRDQFEFVELNNLSNLLLDFQTIIQLDKQYISPYQHTRHLLF